MAINSTRGAAENADGAVRNSLESKIGGRGEPGEPLNISTAGITAGDSRRQLAAVDHCGNNRELPKVDFVSGTEKLQPYRAKQGDSLESIATQNLQAVNVSQGEREVAWYTSQVRTLTEKHNPGAIKSGQPLAGTLLYLPDLSTIARHGDGRPKSEHQSTKSAQPHGGAQHADGGERHNAQRSPTQAAHQDQQEPRSSRAARDGGHSSSDHGLKQFGGNVGKTILNFLKAELNLTDAQAKGILANIMQESGGRVDAVGDGGTSKGIVQWHGPRLTGLNAFAAKLGGSPNDLMVQLKYLKHELLTTESKSLRALRSTTTAEEATRSFSVNFERPSQPHMARRLAFARQLSDMPS